MAGEVFTIIVNGGAVTAGLDASEESGSAQWADLAPPTSDFTAGTAERPLGISLCVWKTPAFWK